MMRWTLTFTLAFCLVVEPASAQTLKALTQDGRLVILQSDGTWKYAEEPTSQDRITRARPTWARLLIVGKQVPYGLWVNHSLWRVVEPRQNEAAEYEFAHARGNAGAIVIAERTQVAPDTWKQIVITNARREAADARITREERKTVNGVDLIVLQTEGTAAAGPVVYYGYYYAGPRGAVQLITYTFANLFDQYREELTRLLDGFVLLQ